MKIDINQINDYVLVLLWIYFLMPFTELSVHILLHSFGESHNDTKGISWKWSFSNEMVAAMAKVYSPVFLWQVPVI